MCASSCCVPVVRRVWVCGVARVLLKAFSHSDIELQVIKDVYTELLCHTHITCVCNPSDSILLPGLFVLEEARGHIRSDLLTL